MIYNSIIQNLVDYILLNAYSINDAGYYNGKAGMCLALFEASGYLQDEYIEEQAFELLQEALISQTDDISFENGLSGIGYVLYLLIERGYIAADFDELFGDKLELIFSGLKKIKDSPHVLLNSIRITYFLSRLKSLYPNEKEIDSAIKALLEASELYLAIQFFDFIDLSYINNKNRVLSIFETYLQTVWDCGYPDYSRTVQDAYVRLYRKGRIMSSYKVAHYLEKLNHTSEYNDIIADNRCFFDSKQPQKETLKSCIERAEIIGDHSALMHNLFAHRSIEGVEKAILQSIPRGAFVAGYEYGVSRLLLYLTRNKINNNK